MSKLIIDAKTHLAIKVVKGKIKENLFLFNENNDELVHACVIENYNPHDPNSPYAMKYLRGLLIAVEKNHWTILADHTMYDLIDPINLIEVTLKATGYTGKVWEE